LYIVLLQSSIACRRLAQRCLSGLFGWQVKLAGTAQIQVRAKPWHAVLNIA
jgi:hypothetical protein